MINIFEVIKTKWYMGWKHIPLNIIRGIKNVIRWLPVIWNDRDWDYSYALIFLKMKLQFMSDYHQQRQFYVGWENNVKWMRTIVKLIDKVIQEDYTSEYNNYHSSSYVFNGCSNIDDDEIKIEEFKSSIINENFDDYFKKHPNDFKIVYNKAKKRNINLDINDVDDKLFVSTLLGYHLHNKAKKILFSILDWKIEHFWD